MKSGLHDYSTTLLSQLGVLGLGIAMQSCLAWFLGPADRGSYAVCLVFAALLTVFCSVGSTIANTYFVASGRFSISEGVIYAIFFGGASSVVAIATGLLLMQLPLSLLEKATPTAFYLGLLTIPVSLFSQTLSGLLTSVRQFGWFAIVSVGQAASKLLFVLLFVSVLSWGVVGALLAVTAGGVLTIAATLLVLRWKCGIGWVKPAIHRAREVFFYGFRYYFGKISNTINFQIGTILLALFATKEEIGLFAVAVQIASRVMMIPDTLTTVLVPRIAGDTEGRSELVAQCARLTAVVCGALLLVLAVLARPIVIVLFSPDFLPAALLIQIIAVGVFVRCTCKVFVPYLAGTGRPGLVSTSVACGTVVNLAVLWWLLPIIGVPAAAVGMVAGYFTSSTLLLLAFRRLSGMKLWRIWKFKFSDWDVLLKTLPHASPRVAGTE